MRIVLSLFILLCCSISAALAQPEIYINIPQYQLMLVDNGQVIKTYDIAVGTPYEPTPIGSFKIFYKEKNPTWFPGAKFNDQTPVPTGPDNPLGTRWMEFHPTYGIHGTNKGWDIQYPVSGGCIRMHDADARELYEVVTIGTPVNISYETIFFMEKPDGLYVRILPDIYQKRTTTTERMEYLFSKYSGKYTKYRELTPPKLDDVMYEAKVAAPAAAVDVTKPQSPISKKK